MTIYQAIQTHYQCNYRQRCTNQFTESSDPSITFFVEDSGACAAGIAFSDRFGDEITDENDIVAQSTGEASFTVKLTSEPTDHVTITLSLASGTLSDNRITFDSSNWDTEKTVTITGLTEDLDTFDITASDSSNEDNYNSLNTTLGVVEFPPTDTAKIKVTEGGSTQDTAEIAVNINGVQDALEGQPTPGQFTVSLKDEASAGG
ncbi:hypothetical protein [Okeania sp.]|uniref:hypothetical protein n=1 Tax=Okeania sp. TaxID=3100323 RepID=UPI002B4B2239|nr:hypothetical protein [Okeania sp.]MEB3341468.1 hypothetical protein [Okeania sp.]